MNEFLKKLKDQKEPGIVLLLLTLITGGLFLSLLDGSHVFISSDTLSPQAIAKGMEAAKASTGSYPLWLPWIFSGLPAVHSFQYISHYYFPHHIFLFLKSMGMPWFWTFFTHYIFAGFGGYLLLKRLRLSVYSAFLGAVAFMITPYMITMIVFGHGSQMMTAAYIPWIIWALIRLEERPGFTNGGILAALMALQLLRAHIQIAYYTWMMVGLYLVIRLIQMTMKGELKEWAKRTGYILPAMVLALGAAMSIYYPVSAYTPFSIRGASGGGAAFDYATQWSFSLPEMMTFLIPSFFGFGGQTYWGSMPFTDYPNYMGIFILILAVIGSVFHRSGSKWLFIVTAIFALVLSFGKHFFLYGLFYDYFPYFNKFRVPAMFLVLTQFSTAVLAGMGMEVVFRQLRNIETTRLISRIGIGWVVLAAVFFLFGAWLMGMIGVPAPVQKMVGSDTFLIMILLGMGVGLLYLSVKSRLDPKWVLVGIIILSVIDLTAVDMRIIEPEKGAPRQKVLKNSRWLKSYLKPDPVIQFLQKDDSRFRILPLRYLMNENRWAAFNLESVSGYHPAKLANYDRIMKEVGFQHPAMLRMLNVKYLVGIDPIEHPELKKVFSGNYYIQGQYVNANVYEYVNWAPRLNLVEKVTFIPEREKQYDLLKNPVFDPVRQAFVSEPLDEYIFNPEDARYKVITWSSDFIEVETSSTSDQFLVFSEIYYPAGWIAKIDGEPAPILETNAVLRGMQIPSGNHRITMSFEPEDIRTGNLISRFSLGMILLLIVVGRFRKRTHV